MRHTTALIMIVASLSAFVLVEDAASRNLIAAVFDMCDWEEYWASDCPDAVEWLCVHAKCDTWNVYDETDVWEHRVSDAARATPQVSLWDWKNSMMLASDADITTHGSDGGRFLAEVYTHQDTVLARAWRNAAYESYLESPSFDETEIFSDKFHRVHSEVGHIRGWYIGFRPAGIQSHLSDISDDALLVANYCHSCDSRDCWGLSETEGGAYLCHQGSVDAAMGCTALQTAMEVMGCLRSPEYSPESGDAAWATVEVEDAAPMECEFSLSNRYHLDRDCHNPAAAFDGVFAFDGKVVFRTVHEAGSICLFVTGLDSWGDASVSDWKSWDVLARVKPLGGRGTAQLYEVDDVPGKAVYRIVEVDRYGRATFSPAFVRGARPAEYDLWLAHPAITTAESDGRSASSGLWQWISGRRVPYERQLASQGHEGYRGRLDGGSIAGSRVDSTYCADIVVYTNSDYDSLLPPVWNHLSDYPSRKVMYFTGSSSLDDARTCYTGVYLSNVAYNQATGTDRFPTDSPGPLLLIVGDSGAAPERTVVPHGSFDDSYDRCYLGVCLSDRDATDVTGEGWIGLVHRIPGATVAEVTAACEGADDWNTGEYVDPGHQVIQIVGNELAETVVDWPVAMADRAASEFLGEGYLPKPVLVEGDFGEGESKVAAFNAQLETGAAVLWGFGRATGAAGYSKWPGSFVGSPDSTYHTRKQRMIALLPGCSTMHVYIGYSPLSAPRIERWMFNEPELTQIVGGVGHLVGAWEHQHRKAEELYTAAWAEAPEDAPLDWVVWRAARMAEEQEHDWMSEYFRSAVTVGGYVLCRPGDGSYTSVPDEAGDLPVTWSLRQNAPNPFNPTTTLEYSVPGTGGRVRMDVYDASGRHVASLVDADKAPGVYATTWNGVNDNGVKVSSGVYFCRMQAPGFSEQRKLTVIK
ncbi:MAG: FlgD immunoglobulin-like domain containing protein [Candidatus Eisenbacteria bacterium]